MDREAVLLEAEDEEQRAAAAEEAAEAAEAAEEAGHRYSASTAVSLDILFGTAGKRRPTTRRGSTTPRYPKER